MHANREQSRYFKPADAWIRVRVRVRARLMKLRPALGMAGGVAFSSLQ